MRLKSVNFTSINSNEPSAFSLWKLSSLALLLILIHFGWLHSIRRLCHRSIHTYSKVHRSTNSGVGSLSVGDLFLDTQQARLSATKLKVSSKIEAFIIQNRNRNLFRVRRTLKSYSIDVSWKWFPVFHIFHPSISWQWNVMKIAGA